MSMNIRFENGQCGLVDAGWIVKGNFPFTMLLRILCKNGAVEWIFRAGKNIEKRDQQTPITIYKSDGSLSTEKARQVDTYYLEWEYFLNCLENNKDVNNATFKDGYISLRLALMSVKSAKEMKAIKF